MARAAPRITSATVRSKPKPPPAPALVDLSVEQAATRLVELINSSPRSPSKDAIASVVRRVRRGIEVEHVDSADNLHGRIRALMPPLRTAIVKECDGINGAATGLDAMFDRLVGELLSRGARTVGDLVLMAEVAQHECRDWPEPFQRLPMLDERSLSGGQGDYALRQLCQAVLAFGGRRYA